MLNDTPRKLLLIINHYSRHFGSMPGMPELERLSGRTSVDIRSGLLELVKENYIEWKLHSSPETARIIEGWERDNPSHRDPEDISKRSGAPSNIDYWLYY